jgi:hypothetical protein
MLYYIAISVLACVVVLHVQAAACRLPLVPRCCRCPRSPRGRVVVVMCNCTAFVFACVERAVVVPVLSAV